MDGLYEGNAIGYGIEPVSGKGLHRYLDFYSALPPHIRERGDLMKIVYMFQDYLNDGYRLIPTPTVVREYKSKTVDICGSSTETTRYTEITRPLNHTPSMHKNNIYSIYSFEDRLDDEYDKERDIDTWSIDFDEIDAYKASNSTNLIGASNGYYSYYNEPKTYYSVFDFYSKWLDVVKTYGISTTESLEGVYVYISQEVKDSSVSLDQSAVSLDYIKTILSRFSTTPKFELTYYACDRQDFVDVFSSVGSGVTFTIESRKTPMFYGISDYNDYNTTPSFTGTGDYDTVKNSIPLKYNNSFRVTVKFTGKFDTLADVLSEIDNIESQNDSFAIKIFPVNENDMSVLSTFTSYCIASSLQVIQKYQHPEVFYNAFGWQNQYRHANKNASVAEKIYRLAYSKDPNVFDYSYLGAIAQHFGYSIETDESEINQNSYYRNKDEKELALRKIIANMPEFNRMKGTSNGIEMVILSFGLVGRVVDLFTRGDSSKEGYAEFIDSRLISGDLDDYVDATNMTVDDDLSNEERQDSITTEMANQFKTNPRLANTSIYDWYACPHFRVEFDIGKDSLSIARSSNQFSTIAKTIKKIKPINTVFQGFYAKLTEEFGSLFILPPACINKVKQVMLAEESCEFTDVWGTQCALELLNGN